MILIGGRRGRKQTIQTDKEIELMQFAELMDRVEYKHDSK